MIYAKAHSKDKGKYEDPKTSSVFETMIMLPDDLFWEVLRSACLDNNNLPEVAGRIENFEFWPHWDSTDTGNEIFVEPDVFIRFQRFDLIVEAKFGEKAGQYSQQWKNELKAYRNEYGKEKPVYFLAVGGNAEKMSEKVNGLENVRVNKCTWLSLLIQITKLRDGYAGIPMLSSNHGALVRLLDLIELAFYIHEVYNIHWFNDIKTSRQLISADSVQTFNTYFK